ncbi:lysosomal acid phosphatase [Hypomesus transpacificus]|uniref:lysosomal acid phosphatase n=1 Tax=Hypomesus transpacificus TaxID=137520 RepID=UPI001F083D6F|nr:lysosomal acid phosphatase [Hypomesus transpacificus]
MGASTLPTFILTLVVVFNEILGDKRLTFVTVLYRHGDRSPVKAYPTDPYQDSSWPQGFGQLSQEGMRQHFELGKVLRHRYQGFLDEMYDRHQISVRSTDYDRTLMSAQANLAGLYPPNGSQVFRPGLDWQPIPVHTVPQAEERLLSFPMSDCPRYQLLMNETEQTPEFLNMTDTYKDFLEMVRNKTGLTTANIQSVWSVHDTLFCESKHNMSAPSWVTAEVMENLRKLKDFGFQIMFGVYKQQEKSRLNGGILLGQIVKNMSKFSVPDPQRRLRMMMLSAHDTTIVALQSSLGVFNGQQPPYASCHMFELYQEDNGSLSVDMFYHNDSAAEPYPMVLPGCTLHCPLEDFIHLTSPSISNDWEKECQLDASSRDSELMIGLAVCGCLLFLLIILLLTVMYRQKDVGGGYSHVMNEGEES